MNSFTLIQSYNVPATFSNCLTHTLTNINATVIRTQRHEESVHCVDMWNKYMQFSDYFVCVSQRERYGVRSLNCGGVNRGEIWDWGLWNS